MKKNEFTYNNNVESNLRTAVYTLFTKAESKEKGCQLKTMRAIGHEDQSQTYRDNEIMKPEFFNNNFYERASSR